MAEKLSLHDRARKRFLENPFTTYDDIANDLGIPIDTVRAWGRTELWHLERMSSGAVARFSGDVTKQAEQIRLILFGAITSGEFGEAKDLSDLVKAWLSLVKFDSGDSDESFDQSELLDLLKDK